jgi:hypothetical protein
MTTEMCKDGKDYRADWLLDDDLPQWERKFLKDLYTNHINTCPQCRAHFAELTAQAEKAVHPEIEVENEA